MYYTKQFLSILLRPSRLSLSQPRVTLKAFLTLFRLQVVTNATVWVAVERQPTYSSSDLPAACALFPP